MNCEKYSDELAKQGVMFVSLLDIKNLSYFYPQSDFPALKDINLQIEAGEFILLLGRSGSGKSTLARALCRLVPDFYGGKIEGDIIYKDMSLRDWDSRLLCTELSMVFQDAERQILFNQVEREVAFGLENLGMELSLMKRRVAEMMDLLNLNEICDKSVNDLSGGEKHKVALAGVLAMNPRVLILDEPASQLDPFAAEQLLDFLKKINNEMGISIVLVEQKLDRVFFLVYRVVVLDRGEIIFQGSPDEEVEWALKGEYPLFPTLPEVFSPFTDKPLPLTVKEGRNLLGEMTGGIKESRSGKSACRTKATAISENPLVETEKLNFIYPDGKEAVKNLNLQIHPGEIVAFMGANGAGKTTVLKLLMGLLKSRRGRLRIAEFSGEEKVNKVLAYLPQNIQDFFLADKLMTEIKMSIGNTEDSEKVARYWLDKMGLGEQIEMDPRKLSAGEKQRAALACLMASNPSVFLLDEPTMGIDIEQKKFLGDSLAAMCFEEKKAALIVSHDMDFISEYASRVLIMHHGRLIADGPLEEVLADNIFYIPQIMRVFQDYEPGIINRRQAMEVLREIKTRR